MRDPTKRTRIAPSVVCIKNQAPGFRFNAVKSLALIGRVLPSPPEMGSTCFNPRSSPRKFLSMAYSINPTVLATASASCFKLTSCLDSVIEICCMVMYSRCSSSLLVRLTGCTTSTNSWVVSVKVRHWVLSKPCSCAMQTPLSYQSDAINWATDSGNST